MRLSRLGWQSTHADHFNHEFNPPLEPARVAREDRGRYLVLGEFGDALGQVSGRFRHTSADRPAVGDWVAVGLSGTKGRATIHGILPRKTEFARTAAGRTSETQVLAANLDVVFLVTGLDGDFNLRRLERYLTLAHQTGAEPVIVLNKCDLEDDLDLRVRQVEGVAMTEPILVVSGRTGAGLERLTTHLGPGRTGAFLGSSGVGKSTLVNRLLGEEGLPTREVREDDSRGRHTTTRRELFLLPEDGGIVIDTPGLRELQLSGEDLEGSFSDIAELARECRYRDCRHEGEPGCAVQRALQEGTFDPARYESFLEQRKELAWQARRRDQRAQKEEEGKWRSIAIWYRKSQKHNPKGR
jgi:ribosome biogenesis GTPase / thiamine phosphate phosphatase